MKKVFLFVLSAATFFGAQAQVKFGGKAGVNIASITGDDADDFKSKIGFNIGAFVDIPVSENFSVKPELVYSGQGAKFDDDDDVKFNLSYINVPILAKYTFSSGFLVETGPQIGFLASAKYKFDGDTEDAKDGLKSTDFAWAFGLGYQHESGFGVNARYNLGISNIPDEGDGKAKNGVFQVGVFYTFGSGASASK